MDASQYKDYVLTMLFVKYVSDKYAGNPMSLIEIPGGGHISLFESQTAKTEFNNFINSQ